MKPLIQLYRTVATPERLALGNDLGLLLLRVAFGGMMAVFHGAGKFANYGEMKDSFPDPLGVGSPLSMALAVFAELVCGIAVVLGLGTRLALTQLIATMIVAAFVIHGADIGGEAEMAFVYLSAYVALFIAGPGRFSIDHVIRKRLVGDPAAG